MADSASVAGTTVRGQAGKLVDEGMLTLNRDMNRVFTIVPMSALSEVASAGLSPRRFVASSPAWPALSAMAFDLDALARTVSSGGLRGVGGVSLEKLWTEAVFEAIRRQDAPRVPSRLDCLFATRDMDRALDLAEEIGEPPGPIGPSGFPIAGTTVVPATTAGAWVEVDMAFFQIDRVLTTDLKSLTEALAATCDRARRYWAGECCASSSFPEMLAEGLTVDGWGASV